MTGITQKAVGVADIMQGFWLVCIPNMSYGINELGVVDFTECSALLTYDLSETSSILGQYWLHGPIPEF